MRCLLSLTLRIKINCVIYEYNADLIQWCNPVFRIRISFHVDPDPHLSMQIRIRIQEAFLYADPWGSRSETYLPNAVLDDSMLVLHVIAIKND